MNIFAIILLLLTLFSSQIGFGQECEDSVRGDIKQIVYAERRGTDSPIYKMEKAFYVNGKIKEKYSVNIGWSCSDNSGRYAIIHYDEDGKILSDSVFIFRGILPNKSDSVDVRTICDKEDLVYIKECEYRESGELVWEKICWLEKDTIPIVSWSKYEYDEAGELLRESTCRHVKDSVCPIIEHDVVVVESSNRRRTKRYHYNNETDNAFYKQVQWRKRLFSVEETIGYDSPQWNEKKVYGKDGRLKKELQRDGNGNLLKKWTPGNLKMWEFDDSIGLFLMTQVKSKFDKQGNCIYSLQKSKSYSNGHRVGAIGKYETKVTYQYDTLDRWRVKITYTGFLSEKASSNVISEYRDYDENGNLTSYIHVRRNSMLVDFHKNVYEYNRKGDWIKKEVYRKRPGSNDMILEKIITRNIEYCSP